MLQIHNQLQAQFSNLNDDFVRLHGDLDEQMEANARLQAELQKAGADSAQLKAKYEKDVTIVTEELEDTKSVFAEHRAVPPLVSHKSSAVPQMGDRARAKWAEKCRGLLCSFPWGLWVPI